MDMQGKVVIVTGASSGIGIEIARSLGVEGAKVVVTGRDEAKLDGVLTTLQGEGIEATAVSMDVTREVDCEGVVQTAVAKYGRLDVVVNNAGYGPPASLLDTTEALWDTVLDVCLKGVYLMSRAAVPTMLAQGGGAIVNISSVAGKVGFGNRTAYCAAKWGVHGFTEALRAELSEQNIRAYLVCPGAVATPWWGTTNDAQPDEVLARMIQPEEVAEAVRWVLTQPDRIQINEVVVNTFRSPWAG